MPVFSMQLGSLQYAGYSPQSTVCSLQSSSSFPSRLANNYTLVGDAAATICFGCIYSFGFLPLKLPPVI